MNYNHANEINAKIHDWLTNHDKSGCRVLRVETQDGGHVFVSLGVSIKYYPELGRLLAKHQMEAYIRYGALVIECAESD